MSNEIAVNQNKHNKRYTFPIGTPTKIFHAQLIFLFYIYCLRYSTTLQTTDFVAS